jgi:CBS domain-containing membrane protein
MPLTSLPPFLRTGSRFRLFHPILAGASLRERMLSCLGALLGISVTGLLCGLVAGTGPQLPLLIAPIGASAVLLFAVPASPLAQPWPIIGGNTLSAVAGLIAAWLVPDTVVAAGLGVALAIAVMSLTRSLHPPGGAAALTAVIGGPAVAKWGMAFPLMPVCLNSCVLVCLGLVFHRLSSRTYPHHPKRSSNTGAQGVQGAPAPIRIAFREEDLDAALAALDETFDIDREDLLRILTEVETRIAMRSNADIT